MTFKDITRAGALIGLAVLVAVLLLAAGNDKRTTPAPESESVCFPAWPHGANICRSVDPDAGVVCYVYGGAAGGISCLPITETRLEDSK